MLKPIGSIQLFILLFQLPLNSISQEFDWVKSSLSPNMNQLDIYADEDGNVYTTGRFVFTIDFDPGPDEAFLTAPFGGDIFIRKLDENGDFIWAKSILGYANGDQGRSIIVSAEDDAIYIVGLFQDSADFDPGLGTSMLYSTPASNKKIPGPGSKSISP